MDELLQASQTHNQCITRSFNIAENKTCAFFLQPDVMCPFAYQADTTTMLVTVSTSHTDFVWDTSGCPATGSAGHLTKLGGIDKWHLVSQ